MAGRDRTAFDTRLGAQAEDNPRRRVLCERRNRCRLICAPWRSASLRSALNKSASRRSAPRNRSAESRVHEVRAEEIGPVEVLAIEVQRAEVAVSHVDARQIPAKTEIQAELSVLRQVLAERCRRLHRDGRRPAVGPLACRVARRGRSCRDRDRLLRARHDRRPAERVRRHRGTGSSRSAWRRSSSRGSSSRSDSAASSPPAVAPDGRLSELLTLRHRRPERASRRVSLEAAPMEERAEGPRQGRDGRDRVGLKEHVEHPRLRRDRV
jgi:hypothetical protein